ncbi:YggS family pyridoxal phosphate-dependent enzyme [Sphingobacterium rhinopitheci]|uniref:YggS family pyridoxal phosphate-dependent enzyme n=1 Tax=Sphingobacterium rhinopitheci TaxID=2781960 RepID=UPI001F529469|nr:YggS family pyridoxal phosphate-dependent enzyme [Sphingobacterium rhinopitheci]MCI0919934.1 YggS family pyridoxal phosphate-dependent enzyme [Sphingobacterium rhinopitheci]
MSITSNIQDIQKELQPIGVTLVAISKTKPNEDIIEAYNAGQRIFGENMVQELVEKYEQLPKDIEWHLVGHLQTNKVKYIAPFVSLIQSVDSLKLLKEINKYAEKNKRIIDCLLQIDISLEETKFGLDHVELIELLESEDMFGMQNIRIRGLMGIATNTDNQKEIKEDFYELKMLFDGIKVSYFRQQESFDMLSMGMSSDYTIAIEQGSNMVRLGSTVFGQRVTKHFKAK